MAFIDDALKILSNIPSNEQNLRILETIENLVPFVGAGLSSEFGYPGWNKLIEDLADQAGVRTQIDALLAGYQFEEAAEAVANVLPNAFDDTLRLTFDHKALRRPLGKGAVRHLPRIAKGPVLTTNFDRILEAAFEDSDLGFDEVFPGSRIREASRAIQSRQRFLLKLHGDYFDSESRILTLTQYAREYGSPDPDKVDFERPLPAVLGQALGAGPLFFLGCSLRSDRTIRVIARIAKRLPGTIHFALLSDAENTPARRIQLDSWNIRALFFRAGEFQRIEQFLALLAKALSEGDGLTVSFPAATPRESEQALGPLKERTFKENKERIGVWAEEFFLQKEVDDNGGSVLTFKVQGLKVERGEITGFRFFVDCYAGAVGDLQLDAETVMAGVFPQIDPNRSTELLPIEKKLESVRKLEVVFGFSPLRPEDPPMSIGWSLRVLNGDALSDWEFDHLYPVGEQKHMDGSPIRGMEYYARVVWFPIQRLRTRLTLPARIPKTKGQPFLSIFCCPKTIPATEVLRGKIIDSYPAPESEWVKENLKQFERDRKSLAFEQPNLRSDSGNSVELVIENPRLGWAYSLDWVLPQQQLPEEYMRLIRRSERIRKRLVEHGKWRRDMENGKTDDHAITQHFREFDALIRGQYASREEDERFEIALMTYDLENRRMVPVEALINGAELDETHWDFTLPFGMGLGGACFREATAQVYAKPEKEGKLEYYLPIKGSVGHEVLLALPVDHPDFEEPTDPRIAAARCRQLTMVVTIGTTSLGMDDFRPPRFDERLTGDDELTPEQAKQLQAFTTRVSNLRTQCQEFGDSIFDLLKPPAPGTAAAAPEAVKPKPMLRTVSMVAPVDFVIVTPLAEERDAVLNKLPGWRKLPPSNEDIRVYFGAELPVEYSDGSKATYKIVVVPLVEMGEQDAGEATADAIRRWKPRFVLLVGIAGGLKRAGVGIGDVLVADQIANYELQKMTSAGPIIRWRVHPVNKQLLLASRNVLGEDWMRTLAVPRPESGKPKVWTGVVCTGDKVMADELRLSEFKEVWDRMIGVEMEAFGVASAAFSRVDPPGFFMVRGVSDLADSQKDAADTIQWRAYACDVAASYAVALLASGPVAVKMM